MPDDERGSDLAVAATRMIIGAGDTIELKAQYVDGREFGLRIEDLANVVDNRVSLRCLLPLPGISRDRDGSIHNNRKTKEHDLNELKRSVVILEQARWKTRALGGAQMNLRKHITRR